MTSAYPAIETPYRFVTNLPSYNLPNNPTATPDPAVPTDDGPRVPAATPRTTFSTAIISSSPQPTTYTIPTSSTLPASAPTLVHSPIPTPTPSSNTSKTKIGPAVGITISLGLCALLALGISFLVCTRKLRKARKKDAWPTSRSRPLYNGNHNTSSAASRINKKGEGVGGGKKGATEHIERIASGASSQWSSEWSGTRLSSEWEVDYKMSDYLTLRELGEVDLQPMDFFIRLPPPKIEVETEKKGEIGGGGPVVVHQIQVASAPSRRTPLAPMSPKEEEEDRIEFQESEPERRRRRANTFERLMLPVAALPAASVPGSGFSAPGK